MLSVTVRSVFENLKQIGGDGEVIVIDNSDQDIYDVLKVGKISPLALSEKGFRLVRQDFPSMHSARQAGIEQATGKYVMMSDSHVLWGNGVIRDCVKFMDEHPECKQGFANVGWLDLPEHFSKNYFNLNSEGGIYGPWGGKPYAEPRKISWFFGFRIARREWFLNECGGYGFFSRGNVSWGGGEFYAAIKCWLMGGECWSIPTSPCYHIGPFNKALAEVANYKFRVYGGSGSGKQGIGILAAFYALGGEGFGKEQAHINRKAFEQYGITLKDWDEAKRIVGDDRQWIEDHQVCSFEDLLNRKPWDEDRAVHDN
jgi:glycosyltransferase involved in cell wall biosynthesis